VLPSWFRLKLFFSVNAISAGVLGITSLTFSSSIMPRYGVGRCSVINSDVCKTALAKAKFIKVIFLSGYGLFALAGILFAIFIPRIIASYKTASEYKAAKIALQPNSEVGDIMEEWNGADNRDMVIRAIILALLATSLILIAIALTKLSSIAF